MFVFPHNSILQRGLGDSCIYVAIVIYPSGYFYSGVKAKDILPLQIQSVRPFTETVLPSAGLIGDREPSLERILYF
jgi:hypothetical protein